VGLYGGLGGRLLGGGRDAPETVDVRVEGVVQIVVFELRGDGEPELRSLGAGHVEARDLFLSVHVDDRDHVDGPLVDHAVLANLHDETIKVDDGGAGLEPPRAPGFDIVEHRIGDLRDETCRDVRAVGVFEEVLTYTWARCSDSSALRPFFISRAVEGFVIFLMGVFWMEQITCQLQKVHNVPNSSLVRLVFRTVF
jgi:hypothetical protein